MLSQREVHPLEVGTHRLHCPLQAEYGRLWMFHQAPQCSAVWEAATAYFGMEMRRSVRLPAGR